MVVQVPAVVNGRFVLRKTIDSRATSTAVPVRWLVQRWLAGGSCGVVVRIVASIAWDPAGQSWQCRSGAAERRGCGEAPAHQSRGNNHANEDQRCQGAERP
jgi:hypothetical protein